MGAIVPEEAAVVRRVWHELARRSLIEVAGLMNREGVPHRGAWTRDSVKDIWRRGRLRQRECPQGDSNP